MIHFHGNLQYSTVHVTPLPNYNIYDTILDTLLQPHTQIEPSTKKKNIQSKFDLYNYTNTV